MAFVRTWGFEDERCDSCFNQKAKCDYSPALMKEDCNRIRCGLYRELQNKKIEAYHSLGAKMWGKSVVESTEYEEAQKFKNNLFRSYVDALDTVKIGEVPELPEGSAIDPGKITLLSNPMVEKPAIADAVENRRLGKFKVTENFLRACPSNVQAILAKCIVVRAEDLMAEQAIEYFAYSELFESIELGLMVPEYNMWIDDQTGRVWARNMNKAPHENCKPGRLPNGITPDLVIVDEAESVSEEAWRGLVKFIDKPTTSLDPYDFRKEDGRVIYPSLRERAGKL